MRYTNEIKVGIVVIIGLALMIFGYFYLRGVGLGADMYYVKLNGAAQIAQGNDVRLQGVKIGQVQDVGFDPQTQQPILTLAVRRSNPPFKLLTTYKFSVQNSGLVGENYVDIRGKYDPNIPVYLPNKKGQFIAGSAQGGLLSITDGAEDVVKDLRATMGKLNTTLERINNGVLSAQNQQKLTDTLDGAAKLTNNAAKAFGPQGVKLGLTDPQAQRSLNQTMRNIELASASAARSAQNIEVVSRRANGITTDLAQQGRGILSDTRNNINSLFHENRDEFSHLLGNLDKTANNVAGITETLDFALKQGGFKENAQLTFQSIRRASENIEVATSSLRKLGEDPNTVDSITKSLAALRESAESLRDTAASIKGFLGPDNTGKFSGILDSLNKTAANLDTTTAGIAKMAGDQSLQDNVRGAAENLNGTLSATRSAAERVNALLGGRKPRKAPSSPTDGTPGTTPGDHTVSANPSAFATGGISFTARHLFDEPHKGFGRNFGDLGFETELLGKPFRIGVDNIGDGSDFTLQSGVFLNPNTAVRAGLYRSKLGAGVELRKGRFSLEGNLYDPNHRSYNIYGGVHLSPRLQVLLGRENLQGNSTTSIGIRVSQ